MATATGLMTIAEFESLSDDAARNKELIDGKLVEMPGNLLEHACLCDDLLADMTPPARKAGGRMLSDVLFDFDGAARAPDVALIGRDKVSLALAKKRIQPFAPDLAVEIAGEYELFQDLLVKAQLYLRCGTLEVWLISIKSREVIRLTHERREVLEDNEEVRTSLRGSARVRRPGQRTRGCDLVEVPPRAGENNMLRDFLFGDMAPFARLA